MVTAAQSVEGVCVLDDWDISFDAEPHSRRAHLQAEGTPLPGSGQNPEHRWVVLIYTGAKELSVWPAYAARLEGPRSSNEGRPIRISDDATEGGGARARTRTVNLGIKSPLLCQIELRGRPARRPGTAGKLRFYFDTWS